MLTCAVIWGDGDRDRDRDRDGNRDGDGDGDGVFTGGGHRAFV